MLANTCCTRSLGDAFWRHLASVSGSTKIGCDADQLLLPIQRGLWHDLQQRVGPNQELSNERPVISADEQVPGGCAGGKESHGDERSGPLIPMGKSYGDQNADGFYRNAGPLHQTHRRVADKDALAACVEGRFKRHRHLTLYDPLALAAGRQSKGKL